MGPKTRSNITMRKLRTHYKSCHLFRVTTFILIYFVLEGKASSAPTGTPHNIADSLLTQERLGHQRSSRETMGTQEENPLLGEAGRHQRQIEVKESYHDLPQGIPETSEEFADPDDSLAYFALKVTLERPVVDVGYRDRSRNTMTYFPPDAVPEDFLYSSREEDFLGFLTFKNIEETVTDEKRKNNFAEYSPFYIPPSKGVDYRRDAGIVTTTETPIFLVNSLDTTPSQTTQVLYSVTPHIHDVSSSTQEDSQPIFDFDSNEHVNDTVMPQDVLTTQGDTTNYVIHVSQKSLTSTNSTYSDVRASPPLRYTTEATKPIFVVDDTIENDRKVHTVHQSTTLLPSKSKSLQNYVRPPSNLTLPPKQNIPENNNLSNLNSDIHHTSKTTESSQKSSEEKLRSPPTIFKTIRPIRRFNKQRHSDIEASGSLLHRSYPEGEIKDSREAKNPSKYDIPGIRGKDYPVYETTPLTSFDCSSKEFGGYYADKESRCQVFHVCMGKVNAAFLCPIGTMFNQKLLVCDWWYNVKCPPNESDVIQGTAFLDKQRRSYNPS